jgi:hypothetical protein
MEEASLPSFSTSNTFDTSLGPTQEFCLAPAPAAQNAAVLVLLFSPHVDVESSPAHQAYSATALALRRVRQKPPASNGKKSGESRLTPRRWPSFHPGPLQSQIAQLRRIRMLTFLQD